MCVKNLQPLSLSAMPALCIGEKTFFACSMCYCGVLAEYDYVFEASEYEFPVNDGHDHAYGALESSKYVTKLKWHTHGSVKTVMGCKYGFVSFSMINVDFRAPAISV